jgi:hypothetical protein
VAEHPRGSRSSRASSRRAARSAAPPAVQGPYGSAGPYRDYEVRLERVPGGLRLAAWSAGKLERRAPVIAAGDLPGLVASAAASGVLSEEDGLAAALGDGPPGEGSSPGRAGELRDELRVEPLDEGRLRIARWVLRPNRGWELQQAPVLLPAARYAEALAAACR